MQIVAPTVERASERRQKYGEGAGGEDCRARKERLLSAQQQDDERLPCLSSGLAGKLQEEVEGGEERQQEEVAAVVVVGRRRHSRSTPPSMCGEGRPSVTSNGPRRGRGTARQVQRSRAWEKRNSGKLQQMCFMLIPNTYICTIYIYLQSNVFLFEFFTFEISICI